MSNARPIFGRRCSEHQSDPRYAAARLWVDEIIMPEDTREVLVRCLELCDHQPRIPAPRFGVLQV
ncbi:MAG: hypothetical protein GH143_09025 [Calditrichaeota bacterium]|nr:hypothetical protein [Calditrichota bacterium]